MVSRRDLITGSLLGTAAASPGRDTATSLRASEQADTATLAVRDVLREIRDELRQQFSCSPTSCSEVTLIRQEQRRVLKGSGKFPDFIDIGIDIWERLIDWQTRTQQPLAISRLGDGRYAMAFGVTMLILRPEMAGNHISLGYDAK